MDCGVAGQRRRVVLVQVVQVREVEDQLAGRLHGRRSGLAAAGQQLLDGHAVELGELGELVHGHGTVAALVGADHDRLPAALRLLLDSLQGHPLLLPNGAQPRAERVRVVVRHPASLDRWRYAPWRHACHGDSLLIYARRVTLSDLSTNRSVRTTSRASRSVVRRAGARAVRTEPGGPADSVPAIDIL